MKTLRVTAGQRHVAFQTENLESLPAIQADERRLFNAFYNLINNAIHEVPAGGSITVRGRAEPESKALVLSVTDTGRGMPSEVREKLFTGSVTSRKTGGTGLGTKIVKDVVDAHRGHIRVESQEGLGTTFHLTLPVDPVSSEVMTA